MVLADRSVVPHQGQPVLSVGNQGRGTIFGRMVGAIGTVGPSRIAGRRMVGIQPNLDVGGINGSNVNGEATLVSNRENPQTVGNHGTRTIGRGGTEIIDFPSL